MEGIFCGIGKKLLQGFCKPQAGSILVTVRIQFLHKVRSLLCIRQLCCCQEHRRPGSSFRMKGQRHDAAGLQSVAAVPEFLPGFREFLYACFLEQFLVPEHSAACKHGRAYRSQINASVFFAAGIQNRGLYHVFPLFITFNIRSQVFNPSLFYHHLIERWKHPQVSDHRRKLVCYIQPFQVLPIFLFCLHDPFHFHMISPFIGLVKFFYNFFLIPVPGAGVYCQDHGNGNFLGFCLFQLCLLILASSQSQDQHC